MAKMKKEAETVAAEDNPFAALLGKIKQYNLFKYKNNKHNKDYKKLSYQ